MSMTDPIADLLTRIRNAQSAGKPTVGVGEAVADKKVMDAATADMAKITGQKPAVTKATTPQGIMSDKQARAAGTGGEVLFVVQ